MKDKKVDWTEAIDSLDDAIAIIDTKHIFLSANKAFANLVGVSQNELVGRRCYEVVHGSDAPLLSCPHVKTLETKKTTSLEVKEPHLRKGIFLSTTSPIFDDKGEIRAVVHTFKDITERKKAEEGLQKSESQFKRVFDTIEEAIVASGPDGMMLVANPAAVSLLGYESAGEIIGKPAIDFYADSEQRNEFFQELMRNGHVKNYELTFLRKDGSRVYVLGSAFAQKDNKGNIIRVDGIFSDITERKKVEKALQESEERFRRIFEEGPLGVVIVGLDYKPIRVNKKMCQMLGYSEQELTALTFPEFTHPEDLERELPIAEKLITGELSSATVEKRFIKKNKEIIWVRVTASMIYDRNGKPSYCISMVENITERKQVEEALGESEERYRTLFENAPMAIALASVDSRILNANDAMCQMTGYSRSELEQMNLRNIYQNPEERALLLERLKKQGFVKNFEVELKRKEGATYYTSLTVNPFTLGGRDVFLAMAEDITERKQAEEEMKKRLMKFSLEDGNLYLVKEPLPSLSIEAFSDLIHVGYKGLVISRTPLEEYKMAAKEGFDFLWLSEKGSKKVLPPKLREIELRIENLSRRNVVLIERLDYLISKNSFEETVFFIQHLRELTYLNGTVVILSIDPSTLSKQQLRLLEKEAKEVEPLHEGLTNYHLEVLKSIYKQNNLGVRPSYKDLGNILGISKPTLRKRIRHLISEGFARKTIKGRNKFVELTEKGRSFFLK